MVVLTFFVTITESRDTNGYMDPAFIAECISFNCYGLLLNASYIRVRNVLLLFRRRVRPCVNST